jgi:hypothetical protein
VKRFREGGDRFFDRVAELLPGEPTPWFHEVNCPPNGEMDIIGPHPHVIIAAQDGASGRGASQGGALALTAG